MGKTENKENKENIAPKRLYSCHHRGCDASFVHRTQLVRHKKKCNLFSPKKVKMPWKINEAGSYECLLCSKKYIHRESLCRHLKTCQHKVSTSKPKETMCSICEKTFKYPSELQRHLPSHEKKGDTMIPSFVATVNYSSRDAAAIKEGVMISPSTTDALKIDFSISRIDSSPTPANRSFVEQPDASFVQVISPQPTSSSPIVPTNRPGQTTPTSDKTLANMSSTPVHGSRKWKEILFHTNAAGVREAAVYQHLIQYLKSIRNKKQQFYTTLNSIFGRELLEDAEFVFFLASQLSMNYTNLKRSLNGWFCGGMEERRGKWTLPLVIRQAIFDAWIDYSIPSTANCNGRVTVQISKMSYFQRYNGIENKIVEVQEKQNKRGRVNVTANRMIITETVHNLQKILALKGIEVSVGSILKLKPFFATYPSEKEMSLCLCKICLNTRFMFDALMAKAKKDGDQSFESVSTFLMAGCHCPKSENGFYKWSCCTRKCQDCKMSKAAPLTCSSSDEFLTVDQFELVEKEYEKHNKKTNQIELKKTKLTERVSSKISYRELYKKLTLLRKTYVCHKYSVYNDVYHWPRILQSVPEYGSILHLDYSENMLQLHKDEPQSAHFNKNNYSLHCTVEHVDPLAFPQFKSPYIYHYHFSDEMKHDYAFTSVTLQHLLHDRAPAVIRRKSDNCSAQYKSFKVFGEYQRLAAKFNRSFISYYGASGHGKGLVDAMSAFGVKTPLRNSIITHNFKYKCSQDICSMLATKFKDDPQKQYSVIEPSEILTLRQSGTPVKIAGCMSFHMICFHPDGSILCKENICSCDDCLVGNFLNCCNEKGKVLIGTNGDDDDTDSEVEYEDDQDEFGDELEDLSEKYELRSESVLQILTKNSVIALFSPSNSLDLFYLCKVINFGIATMELRDQNNHCIGKGMPYIEVNYYEKNTNSEFKKGNIVYKLVPNSVYVHPAQVMSPNVNAVSFGSNLHVTREEYQWMCDSI